MTTSDGVMFYLNTVNDITDNKTDENWMNLWINTDQSYKSGWYGYDYRVTGGENLQRFINGTWINVEKVEYKLSKNELIIDIPFTKLGMPSENGLIEFKWSDNMQKPDPMDWYINGDAAPGGRLNIRAEY